MRNFLIPYLNKQPDWLRVPITDLVWLLNTPEKRIRELIKEERIWTGPRGDPAPHLAAFLDADLTQYYVYKYQIIQLAEALGLRLADHPADFFARMDLILADQPKEDTYWKVGARFWR